MDTRIVAVDCWVENTGAAPFLLASKPSRSLLRWLLTTLLCMVDKKCKPPREYPMRWSNRPVIAHQPHNSFLHSTRYATSDDHDNQTRCSNGPVDVIPGIVLSCALSPHAACIHAIG